MQLSCGHPSRSNTRCIRLFVWTSLVLVLLCGLEYKFFELVSSILRPVPLGSVPKTVFAGGTLCNAIVTMILSGAS